MTDLIILYGTAPYDRWSVEISLTMNFDPPEWYFVLTVSGSNDGSLETVPFPVLGPEVKRYYGGLTIHSPVSEEDERVHDWLMTFVSAGEFSEEVASCLFDQTKQAIRELHQETRMWEG